MLGNRRLEEDVLLLWDEHIKSMVTVRDGLDNVAELEIGAWYGLSLVMTSANYFCSQ